MPVAGTEAKAYKACFGPRIRHFIVGFIQQIGNILTRIEESENQR